jgi:hypothetical protein
MKIAIAIAAAVVIVGGALGYRAFVRGPDVVSEAGAEERGGDGAKRKSDIAKADARADALARATAHGMNGAPGDLGTHGEAVRADLKSGDRRDRGGDGSDDGSGAGAQDRSVDGARDRGGEGAEGARNRAGMGARDRGGDGADDGLGARNRTGDGARDRGSDGSDDGRGASTQGGRNRASVGARDRGGDGADDGLGARNRGGDRSDDDRGASTQDRSGSGARNRAGDGARDRGSAAARDRSGPGAGGDDGADDRSGRSTKDRSTKAGKHPGSRSTDDADDRASDDAKNAHKNHGKETTPSGRTFEDLDNSLNWLLSKRGLNWRDVGAVVPEKVQQWSLWRIGAEHASSEDLDRTSADIEHAVNAIHIDKNLIEAKLERVQATLAEFPAGKKGRAYVSLVERFKEAKRLLDRVKKPRDLKSLSSEVTMLESAALAQSTAPDDADTKPKSPPTTSSLDVHPPSIEDTDSSTASRRPSF